MENQVDEYYVDQGQIFISTLLEKGYFRKGIKLEQLRKLDEVVGFMLQTEVNRAIKTQEFLQRINL